MDSSGKDQNSGTIQFGVKLSREDCLNSCKKIVGATGCEYKANTGCGVHTQDVASGSNSKNFECFVFAKSNQGRRKYT